jgi:hypothetical protein
MFFDAYQFEIGDRLLYLIDLAFDIGYSEVMSLEPRIFIKFCWNCDMEFARLIYI